MTRLPSLLLIAALTASPLAAQVGSPPDRSPYRDIIHPNGLLFTYGHIGGDGGSLGIGPHSGNIWGLRYDVRLSGLLAGHLGFARFSGVRDAYYPSDSIAKRRKGPFDQSVTFIGLGLQANLTGPKTWHRLAPFVDGEFGAAVGSTVAADTSSLYTFGTKLYFAPAIGTHIFVTDRLRIRLDWRLIYWNLKYPSSFFQSPADGPAAAPIVTGSASEWTGTSSLNAGLFYSF